MWKILVSAVVYLVEKFLKYNTLLFPVRDTLLHGKRAKEKILGDIWIEIQSHATVYLMNTSKLIYVIALIRKVSHWIFILFLVGNKGVPVIF